jgi:RimJ/RimL family protein N-acetyltransferase
LSNPSIVIRPIKTGDWPRIWEIIAPVFRLGTTYAFDSNLNQQQAKELWVSNNLETFIAEDESGELLGTFYLKANFAGNANHICNCGYIVAERARGKGVAAKMCIESQRAAIERGFGAMQFNFVVSSNHGAIRLWQKLGFKIVGTLPAAFKHPELGLIDAHIMFKSLI